MAVYGADSCNPVTYVVGTEDLLWHAQHLFGNYPAFWGRYFDGTSSSGCSYSSSENQSLSNAGVKVALLARQTGNVNGNQADGVADAEANYAALTAIFSSSQLSNASVFLDVEGSPSLSADYWFGWATTMYGKYGILPSLYATQDDTATWNAINESSKNYGFGLDYIWIASWIDSGCVVQSTWETAYTTPSVATGAEVLIWQYSTGCEGSTTGFDCNLLNPSYESTALSLFVTP